MELRLAKKEDLDTLEKMFASIVEEMNKNGIHIWNEYYPFEEFEGDIEKNKLYLLVENDTICSVFALLDEMSASDCFEWEDKKAPAKYIERLGVNTELLRKGIGSTTLQFAKDICRKNGAKYLRLTVAEENFSAIALYNKNGFNKVEGIFEEYSPSLDKTIVQFGFEIKV